jgi:hypothetical protein
MSGKYRVISRVKLSFIEILVFDLKKDLNSNGRSPYVMITDGKWPERRRLCCSQRIRTYIGREETGYRFHPVSADDFCAVTAEISTWFSGLTRNCGFIRKDITGTGVAGYPRSWFLMTDPPVWADNFSACTVAGTGQDGPNYLAWQDDSEVRTG